MTVHYPTTTASGERVEIDESSRDGMKRIWVHSPDRLEVYLEIVTYPERLDHAELYASQRRFHLSAEGRADAWIDDLQRTELRSLPASRYALGWSESVRAMTRECCFADLPDGTFRLIFDPRSPTNHAIVEYIELAPRGAGDDGSPPRWLAGLPRTSVHISVMTVSPGAGRRGGARRAAG